MPLDIMRLTLLQKTEHEQREATWLRAIEAGEATVDSISRMTGLSRKRIWARIKRARENREFEPDVACVADLAGETPERDDDKLPLLILTDDPAMEPSCSISGEPRQYYDLRTDATTRDSGLVRVGNYNGRHLLVRSLTGGKKTEQKTRQHKPDPKGLKGGVG